MARYKPAASEYELLLILRSPDTLIYCSGFHGYTIKSYERPLLPRVKSLRFHIKDLL